MGFPLESEGLRCRLRSGRKEVKRSDCSEIVPKLFRIVPLHLFTAPIGGRQHTAVRWCRSSLARWKHSEVCLFFRKEAFCRLFRFALKYVVFSGTICGTIRNKFSMPFQVLLFFHACFSGIVEYHKIYSSESPSSVSFEACTGVYLAPRVEASGALIIPTCTAAAKSSYA